jgi:hypothetical protein
MPNWCSNCIEFDGSEKAMKSFRKDVESIENGQCIFTALTDYKGEWDCNDWVKEFGTKWGVEMDEDIRCSISTNDYFNCETAWSPCIGFVEKVCKKYGIGARITYAESGNDFGGFVDIDEKGYRIDEKEMSYMEYQYVEDLDSFYYDFRMNVENDWIDSEEQIRREYSYVSDDDMETLISIYREKSPAEN